MTHPTSEMEMLKDLFFIIFNVSVEYFQTNDTLAVFDIINNVFITRKII